jgi:hypothetical protein
MEPRKQVGGGEEALLEDEVVAVDRRYFGSNKGGAQLDPLPAAGGKFDAGPAPG